MLNINTIGIIYIAVLHRCRGQDVGSKNDSNLCLNEKDKSVPKQINSR